MLPGPSKSFQNSFSQNTAHSFEGFSNDKNVLYRFIAIGYVYHMCNKFIYSIPKSLKNWAEFWLEMAEMFAVTWWTKVT